MNSTLSHDRNAKARINHASRIIQYSLKYPNELVHQVWYEASRAVVS